MASELIIAAAVRPLIKSIADNIITPKVKRFAKKCNIAYNDLLIPKGAHFEMYLSQMYEKYSSINTLVFHNSQRKLKDIYVAQTLVKEYCSHEKDKYTEIDKLPVELIKKYKKILIKDTAGMGKSTIMKRMFIDLIDNGMKDIGIPIYIEMNRLSRNRTIEQEIQKQLDYRSIGFDKELLFSFIQSGGFVFFLDGYDEISIRDIGRVTKNVQDFISKASTGNYFILASRPESILSSFGDFQLFRIKPLRRCDAFQLLKNYDWSDNKVISGKLIKLLESGYYSSINEYLENPLLVSLLYAAFDHKQVIPLKKHLFYRQVFDAFFDTHDLSKGIEAHQKRSGLDIDGFNKVLRYVGFMCLKSVGVKFEKQKILSLFGYAKAFYGNLEFKEEELLEDLLVAVPLFCQDGAEYRWAHKSLIEYFAALFISEDAKQEQDNILKAIYNSKSLNHYINMLDLYFDIDFNGFSKNFTLPICEQFLCFRKEQMEELKLNKIMTKSDIIEERIKILFMCRLAFFWTYKNENQVLSEKEFKKQLGDDSRISFSFIYKNSRIWESYQFNRNPLHELLYNKRASLFESISFNGSSDKIIKLVYDYITKQIKQKEVCIVSSSLGKENLELYRSINMFLKEKILQHVFFSYKSCEWEVERIKDNLSENKNVFDLSSGM